VPDFNNKKETLRPYSLNRRENNMTTYNQLIKLVTEAYIDNLEIEIANGNAGIVPDTIEAELIEACNKEIDSYNADDGSGNPRKVGKYQRLITLLNFQVAMLLVRLHHACVIRTTAVQSGDNEYNMVGMYVDDPDDHNYGIYVTDDTHFSKLIDMYNPSITVKGIEEILMSVRRICPVRDRTAEKDLIAVNNGIFDYKTKELLPFSKDYVFMSKSKVNYNENAANVNIHNDDDNTDWNVEEWFESLSDDPEIVALLWEIMSAIIRPNVTWGKSAWLYSAKGNNGKGTLCTLMRNICGAGTWASIPISDFSKEFLLEPLTRVSAIIVDENDVGTYVDQAANLKAVITNDAITINRKFKAPIVCQFHGFMVQCMNELPRIKDRSDSFYRRQLFVPMEKWFGGSERKYIKDDYLHRPEVLEYVLYKILNTNFYKLSTPASSQHLLNEYKVQNDPVRDFFYELEIETTWTLLPFDFIYDYYVAWFRKNNPNGTVLGKYSLLEQVKRLAGESRVFDIRDKSPVKPGDKMDAIEPIIGTYQLKDWCTPSKTGDAYCRPAKKKATYRGLLRYPDVPIHTRPDDGTNDPRVPVNEYELDTGEPVDIETIQELIKESDNNNHEK
jgi:poxvirus D5 protein-like